MAVLGRPSWDEYFINIMWAVSARADCKRRKNAAVIVKNHRIVATGYNAAPAGGPSCLAGECPRGFLSVDEIPNNHADYTNCIGLHAEQNAIAYASRDQTEGATMYLSGAPCDMCSKLIAAAGIIRVVTP